MKDLIYKDSNHMHCLALNKVTIFPNNTTSNCRWNRYTKSDFNTPLNRQDNASMMQAYMDEHGCLSCKWWNKCGFRCYTQWDWKNRERDLPDCVMRMWFNYMEKVNYANTEKKYNQAIIQFEKAEAAAKKKEEEKYKLPAIFYLQFGAACESIGQIGRAEQIFKKCIELYPDSHQVLNYLAYMLAEQGIKLDQALS